MSMPPAARCAAVVAAALALALIRAAAGARRPPPTATSPSCSASATTQDLDASATRSTRTLVVGLRGLPAHLRPADRLRQGRQARAGLRRHRGSDRRTTVTFHIRDGMKWSDGDPATSADVCFTWGLALAAIKADVVHRQRLPRPGPQGRRRDEDRVPGRLARSSPTPPTSRTGSSRSTCRSCPSTSAASSTTRRSREREVRRAARRHRPVHAGEWKTGQFARFVRNPNYWGTQGFADEVVLQFFPDATDTMVQALKSGELDYAHNVNPTSSSSSQTDPAFTAVEGKANGWTQIAFNTYGTGHRQDDRGRRPVHEGPARPRRSATPWATRSTRTQLVERVLGGFGDVGTTNVPPILADWHVEPDDAPHVRHRARQAEARGRRLPAQRRRQAPRQGGQADHASACSTRTPTTSTPSPRSSSQEWYGELGIDVSLAEPRQRHRSPNRVLPPEGDPPGKADYDIEIWGWSGQPGSELPAVDLHVRRDRRLVRQPVLQPGLRRAVRPAERRRPARRARRRSREMQNLIYDEAPYDILFYDSYLDVYRNDRFAGWQNMPADGGIAVLHVRDPRTTPC